MQNINDIIDSLKVGISGGFPSSIKYIVKDSILSLTFGDKQKTLREFDCWGFAYFDALNELLENNNIEIIKHITFEIKTTFFKQHHIESFKRRLSFLNENNQNIKIDFYLDTKQEELYTISKMIEIGKVEILRNELKTRTDDNTSGKLEKDFQSYLFGKDLQIDTERTNERLALLGSDFLKQKNKKRILLREFPTGSFKNQVKEENRIMPTEYIDLVTTNKEDRLSLIELKVSDIKLDVISQSLDYSLYFIIYKNQLNKILSDNNISYNKKVHFNTYIVNNNFHSRFNSIFKYYQPSNNNYFKFIKTTIGYYEN